MTPTDLAMSQRTRNNVGKRATRMTTVGGEFWKPLRGNAARVLAAFRPFVFPEMSHGILFQRDASFVEFARDERPTGICNPLVVGSQDRLPAHLAACPRRLPAIRKALETCHMRGVWGEDRLRPHLFDGQQRGSRVCDTASQSTFVSTNAEYVRNQRVCGQSPIIGLL